MPSDHDIHCAGQPGEAVWRICDGCKGKVHMDEITEGECPQCREEEVMSEQSEFHCDLADFIGNRPGWFDVKRRKNYGREVLAKADRLEALAALVPGLVEALDGITTPSWSTRYEAAQGKALQTLAAARAAMEATDELT